MGSRVQLFADIRHDARVDGLSIRELARKHGVHRRTVRQALASAEPPPRKTPVRTAPRLAPYKPAIDQMLLYDLTAPRKQRHTATRILARLRDEHGDGPVLLDGAGLRPDPQGADRAGGRAAGGGDGAAGPRPRRGGGGRLR